MSASGKAQSKNAAACKAKPRTSSSSNSNRKFSAAGRPAGITSASKMLGDNRFNPSPNDTTTDPFASIPQFPDKLKMDGDDRSSVSDNDDTVQVNEQKPKPAPGKKTRGRVKIQMEYIQNKLRRYTTFSKRKSGIMKKAYELSTLTGTQVMLLVASETGHVYTFATPKLQPMITSEAGKALIQTCLHQPDPPHAVVPQTGDYEIRMSSSGYEETELGYGSLPEEDFKGSLDVTSIHPVSTVSQMPTMMNQGPIVTIPHGMMQVPAFPVSMGDTMTSQSVMHSHPMTVVQPLTSSPSPHHSMSPHHSPPPPNYASPHHPASPQTYTASRSSPNSSPPTAHYFQSSHVPHQAVMMQDELGSPIGHHGIDSYDRSPSRSPIQHRYASPHHSPQVPVCCAQW